MVSNVPLRMDGIESLYKIPTRRSEIRMFEWDIEADAWRIADKSGGSTSRWYTGVQARQHEQGVTHGIGGAFWYATFLRGLNIGEGITRPFFIAGLSVYQNGEQVHNITYVGNDGKITSQPSPEYKLLAHLTRTLATKQLHIENGWPIFQLANGEWQIARVFEFDEECVLKRLPRLQMELADALRSKEWVKIGLDGLRHRIKETEREYMNRILPNRIRLDKALCTSKKV